MGREWEGEEGGGGSGKEDGSEMGLVVKTSTKCVNTRVWREPPLKRK